MELRGTRPPGDNPLLFSISGTGSFIIIVPSRTDTAGQIPIKAFDYTVVEHWGGGGVPTVYTMHRVHSEGVLITFYLAYLRLCYIFSIKLPHNNLTTLYLNGTLSCVDFMDVIMGDIPSCRPRARFLCSGFHCEHS